jgi:hypothetical protein
MARARTIKPGFFKNEDLAECSFEARLLFAGLWTLADRDGRLEYRPKRIKAELFPFDAVEIHDLAVELHGRKLLVMYEVAGTSYIEIPGFRKHQRPHPKEPRSELPQPPCVESTYDKAVEKHGEPCKETASCAFPSSNPLILQSSNPSPGDSSDEPDRDGDAKAMDDFIEAWNKAPGCVHVRLPLSLTRRRHLRARIRDPAWNWREALAKFPLKCLEHGGWKPDLDWIVKPDTVTKIIEGKYDWNKSDGKPKLTPGQQFDPSRKLSWDGS